MTALLVGGPVIVLDRDGTVIVDRHYLGDPDGLEFTHEAEEGLRELQALGCRLVLATNQSGIGRGLLSADQVQRVNERLRAMVEAAGARLEAIYVCPHAPQEQCECRKPAPGMLLRAAAELGFEPSAAVVVGDKASDVEFGLRAGATTILFAPSPPQPGTGPAPHFVARTLREVAQIVAEQLRTRRDARTPPAPR
jgi:D-glycero-D-manno-heptose 1,7-bisphosphate phosphatase